MLDPEAAGNESAGEPAHNIDQIRTFREAEAESMRKYNQAVEDKTETVSNSKESEDKVENFHKNKREEREQQEEMANRNPHDYKGIACHPYNDVEGAYYSKERPAKYNQCVSENDCVAASNSCTRTHQNSQTCMEGINVEVCTSVLADCTRRCSAAVRLCRQQPQTAMMGSQYKAAIQNAAFCSTPHKTAKVDLSNGEVIQTDASGEQVQETKVYKDNWGTQEAMAAYSQGGSSSYQSDNHGPHPPSHRDAERQVYDMYKEYAESRREGEGIAQQQNIPTPTPRPDHTPTVVEKNSPTVSPTPSPEYQTTDPYERENQYVDRYSDNDEPVENNNNRIGGGGNGGLTPSSPTNNFPGMGEPYQPTIANKAKDQSEVTGRKKIGGAETTSSGVGGMQAAIGSNKYYDNAGNNKYNGVYDRIGMVSQSQDPTDSEKYTGNPVVSPAALQSGQKVAAVRKDRIGRVHQQVGDGNESPTFFGSPKSSDYSYDELGNIFDKNGKKITHNSLTKGIHKNLDVSEKQRLLALLAARVNNRFMASVKTENDLRTMIENGEIGVGPHPVLQQVEHVFYNTPKDFEGTPDVERICEGTCITPEQLRRKRNEQSI